MSPLFEWKNRRAKLGPDLSIHLSARDGMQLHDKMRQAYWWIINNAIICPHYDIAFGGHTTLMNISGDKIQLPGSMSYSSYVLIPLLTLFTQRKALMIGGPGRGKTTSAIIMALIAGMPKDEVRRSILRGHPQLSVSDLLGAPLPADLMKAQSAEEVKISWRKWISGRVKIIDEYNRIPTKTQSALLSLMSDGYAEMLDQYVYSSQSSWFLTANDDAGGGTFQVIDALKDRIDVVVRAVPFNSGFIDQLLKRLESGVDPQDHIPADIIFSAEELTEIDKNINAVPIPSEALDQLGFFLGQLDFCRRASPDFEYMSKDTLHLAGKQVASVCDENCPLDKRRHLCTQTENGVSARAYLTCLHFAKALAYFRGESRVEWEDMRQIVPWVLHEKLKPNHRSAFFADDDQQLLLGDRVAWIRQMMDRASEQYLTVVGMRQKVADTRNQLETGLDGVSLKEAKQRQKDVLALMTELLKEHEFSGFNYEMLQQLKAFHSRYKNYLVWLSTSGKEA